MDAEWTKVSKIECLGEVDDYVYDLSIEDNDPFFFASDILVHNTDSCYFTAYPTFKTDIDSGSVQWSKEVAITVYDAIADNTNDSFPQFMERAFHAPPKNGSIIKAGRELIGDRALFIKKKKYAINIYDKEGKRKDVDGRRGSIKAMGLDTKRSDTPKYVQVFLQQVLEEVLAGANREDVIKMIVDFKTTMSEKPAWEKGSPRAANKLTWYQEQEDRATNGKFNMPGHVRAALNWNNLRRMHGDNYSMRIVDGMKVIVCKLRPNALNYTSIAYPTDELRLPAWFKELPFDDSAMETTLVDQKLDNLIGILKWDFKQDINIKSSFNNLFSFE